MSADNVQALPPGTELGDFRLDAVIGHGGFGITYRALDRPLAKIVAIKEYLPVEFAVRQGDSQVVPRGARFAEDFAWGRDRFLDEARALARFRHPHIVPVLRHFEANNTAYTVMEFEDGDSLAALLRSRRLSPEDVLRLADGLVSGLAAVHAQDFLHRDIKPANIIVRRDGVPVLIDFGAARQAIGGRTHTLTGVLTPQYAPIEQYALDGHQGPWSDVYSAAAVLYHAVIGKPPPDAASRAGVDPYRPLADTEHNRFERPFLTAIDRGLAFAPGDRPPTVEHWKRLFGPSLARADQAPTQRLAGRAEDGAPRLGGVTRRPEGVPVVPHQPRSRLGFWLMLVLIAGGAAAFWQYHGELRARLLGTPAAAPTTAGPSASPAAPPATPANGAEVAAGPRLDPTVAQTVVEQARSAAIEARAALESADEAARTAASMAGEARIVAAKAARPDLERAERRSYEAGAVYVGQVVDGKRQGLGVAELASGERQAGDWSGDRLNGLGTVRFADEARYAGQLRDGLASGLGVLDRAGGERIEGNFVAGEIEGLAVRRTTGAAATMQAGTFRGGLLEGPGVETQGEMRYEGTFKAGRRNGYGQVTGADGKTVLGRWQDGKLLATVP